MCDYCGCRSDATIAGLSAEHERLAGLASDVERALQAGDLTGARTAFGTLARLLDAHTRSEEGGLFAELLAAGELTDAVEARCAEHDEIGAAVDSAGLAGAGGWPAAARRALALLGEHIWWEETDLFPAAALALSAISLGATR